MDRYAESPAPAIPWGVATARVLAMRRQKTVNPVQFLHWLCPPPNDETGDSEETETMGCSPKQKHTYTPSNLDSKFYLDTPSTHTHLIMPISL